MECRLKFQQQSTLLFGHIGWQCADLLDPDLEIISLHKMPSETRWLDQ